MAIKFEINMTNRWLYFLIALGVLLALGIGVWAYQSGGPPSAMGHSAEEIEAGTLQGDYSITGKLGIGTTNPTSPLHILETNNNWLALEKPEARTWQVKYSNLPNMQSVPMLKIDNDRNPGLGFYIDEESQLHIWDSSRSLPNMPHTNVRPSLSVLGDILIGDIIAIERNPMTYFMRVERNLPATAITQLFSSRGGNTDTDGGAVIVLAPDEAGNVNSGYISLVAYGRGTGNLANSILFRTRSGPNTLSDRMIVKGNGNVGIGTTNPVSKLHVIGKGTFTGGIDPPYISFSSESHESIRKYAKKVEEHEKVMVFWNDKTHKLEVYHTDEDRFYTITGELIT